MKSFVFVSIFCVAQLACYGRDTAYQALRVLGKQKNQAVINHVIEVQGHTGSPQPATWKIIVDDPVARAGVREFEIANGRIVVERTPIKPYTGAGENAVMDLNKLNLDSAGAFTIAEQEASKTRLGFDTVDYVLRRDEEREAPVWVLRLLDSQRRNVGTLYVAADSGTVLRRSGFGEQVAEEQYPPETTERTERTERTRRTVTEERGTRDHRSVGHEIDKTLHRIGGSLEEFFTGKRTVDRRFQNED
jgi:hypothetical protein